jgi:hypothetical protein
VNGGLVRLHAPGPASACPLTPSHSLTLPSRHQNWYFGNDRDKLLPNCLFRVGGAAILLSNRRRDAWYAACGGAAAWIGHAPACPCMPLHAPAGQSGMVPGMCERVSPCETTCHLAILRPPLPLATCAPRCRACGTRYTAVDPT